MFADLKEVGTCIYYIWVKNKVRFTFNFFFSNVLIIVDGFELGDIAKW